MEFDLGQMVEFYRCCCSDCANKGLYSNRTHNGACYVESRLRYPHDRTPSLPVVGRVIWRRPNYYTIALLDERQLLWEVYKHELRLPSWEEMPPQVPPIDYKKWMR